MKEAKHCAERLYGLTDPARLLIVQLLRRGPHTVSQIAEALDSTLVNTSYHLNILKRCGITEALPQGRHVLYRLRPDVYGDDDCLDFGCCKLRLPA